MAASARSGRQANLLGALALAVMDRLHDQLTGAGRRSLSAAAALIHLRLRPGENIDFLARLLGISHPATIRLVDRLADEGLLERRPARDGRSRALFLTDAGQHAALVALGVRLEMLEDVLAQLTAAERRALEPVLEKLLISLTADRWQARHTCRLCDFATCADPACPVDRAAAPDGVRVATLRPVRRRSAGR